MNTMEYLSQGRWLDKMILFHMDRLRELRERADSIGAARMKEVAVMQPPSGEAPYVRTLQQIWETEETVERELQQMIRLEQQINRVIDSLLSGNYRMVLRYRYLDRKTWEQIADLLYIDPSTAKRWHKKAIDLLTLPDDAINLRETPAADPDMTDLPPAA